MCERQRQREKQSARICVHASTQTFQWHVAIALTHAIMLRHNFIRSDLIVQSTTKEKFKLQWIELFFAAFVQPTVIKWSQFYCKYVSMQNGPVSSSRNSFTFSSSVSSTNSDWMKDFSWHFHSHRLQLHFGHEREIFSHIKSIKSAKCFFFFFNSLIWAHFEQHQPSPLVHKYIHVNHFND